MQGGDDHGYHGPVSEQRPRRWWLWGPAIVTAAGALAVGAGEVALLSIASAGVAQVMMRSRMRNRVDARLARLPFPIVHDPRLEHARPIRRVTVRTRAALDTTDVETATRATLAMARGLSARLAGDALELVGWSWGDDDGVLLATLLSTWAVELHRTHLIAEVAISWDSG